MYNHREIEKKWQKFWEQNHSFKTTEKHNKKAYILDMFPYPSGMGMHVGHLEGYTATDIVSRFKRLNGFDVLHPIGWDAFGLPAEQYALNTGNHPAPFTIKNIDNFRRQLKAMGFSYDYDKEINTTDPKFYYWTQWIFKELYKNGLASIEEVDVNWCEGLGTVLANEEIVEKNGIKVSERGSFPVVKKPMRQWVLKISNYADKLLEGLDSLDWPESLKALQRNWIGKSNGHIVSWKLEKNRIIKTFTTRLDTIYGVSALVLSPEHPLVDLITTSSQKFLVDKYLCASKQKSELERTQLQKEKSGVFTGSYALHPLTNKKIPIWISDYVLMSHGTGAVMSVPAHDERDFQFATRYNLEIIPVIKSDDNVLPYTGNGVHFNSDIANKKDNANATKAIFTKLSSLNSAKEHVSYKLRDWIFSRQRYWGEPFPILFDENNDIYLVKELVSLPETNNIKPSGSTEGPLANIKEWMNVKVNGKNFRRDSNVMPQWAGSSWYYLAYILKNSDGTYAPLDSSEAKKRFENWLPVDLYIGGQEHAVLHLLYARFWHRFLFDIGIVPTKEPFTKLINQGLILGPDGQKMSKSLGNVINPDDLIQTHGADALRIFEMFMGPLTDSKPWNTSSLDGIRKWLDRLYSNFNYFVKNQKFSLSEKNDQLESNLNILIKEATDAIEKYKFNIAISKLMVFSNYLGTLKVLPSTLPLKNFAIIFSVFAPHLAEELLAMINEAPVEMQSWPFCEESKIIAQNPIIGVQINGKVRGQIEIMPSWDQEAIVKNASAQSQIAKWLENKKIFKVIYVENKILNLIVK
ncbi:Leucine--tRNA ligase [Metamycoplasma arthritidis]|uniref:Leucine--tRNA ligase n=1 Tax=Metamycoplasma arthritidis (strain 158L3-1) TaxID=243272 RepID=B3PM43_META1|nr:leucine--tRNA ligase [Metamycoplasma arthritidis]ACF07095.1 leucyl-tRNA synthetase [Metamycoplasma arthritidis 158L3-1]VEU78623.1 Leucine--tRNA ligase [Metamycoplasma arthritidis]